MTVYLYGQTYSKTELLRRVGNVSQIGGVTLGELVEGNERGVRTARFRTGSGLSYCVLLDRGMDIGWAEYRGIPLTWQSPTGAVAPTYFESRGLGWLRSFHGGLMMTCGLTQLGAPCVDDGQELGLHGRISNIPARRVYADGCWDGERYEIWVQGEVRETAVYGENVVLSRRISTWLGESRLFVQDRVENQGFTKAPHMILYHTNFGWPLVDEGAEFMAASKSMIPHDEEAQRHMARWKFCEGPTPGARDQDFFHDLEVDDEGKVTVALVNRKLDGGQGLGLYMKYVKKELPYFAEWKMLGEGLYVFGMSPVNCLAKGRVREREEKRLQYLEPGESRLYHLEIGLLRSSREIEAFSDSLRGLVDS